MEFLLIKYVNWQYSLKQSYKNKLKLKQYCELAEVLVIVNQ